MLASGENHQKVSVKNSQLKSKENRHNIIMKKMAITIFQ